MERIDKNKFEYKWVIVGLCFFMMFVCLGFASGIRNHFIVPITTYLNIERGVFAFNDTFRFISTSIVNLFFGFIVAKIGAKKMMLSGFIVLICSMLCYAFAQSVLLIYLGGILLGVGIAWTGTTLVGYVVAKWFKQNRGTIMGAILCSNALGSAIANKILVEPIVYGSPDGYKTAYYVIAIAIGVVGLLVLLFYREPKEGEGEQGEIKGKKKRGRVWSGIDFKDAVKKPYFYCAIICIVGTGLILQGIFGVATAHMTDVGINASMLTTISMMSSIMLMLMKFLSGLCYDKFGLRVTISICSICSIIAIVLLCFVDSPSMGALAFVYAVFSAIAMPLETIILPLYASDLFGEKSYSKMLGIFVSSSTAGCALGSPVLNFCYDAMGSYVPAFIVFGIIMLCVLVLLQYVITAGHRERKRVESQSALLSNK